MTATETKLGLRPSILAVSILLLQATAGCDASQDTTQKAELEKTTLAGSPANALSTDVDEDALRAAVQPQLAAYLDAIPDGQEETFGFHSRDEFDQCTLGKPFAMFELQRGPKAVFLNYWRIPVLVDGAYRALADVQLRERKYVLTAIGAAQFAPQLEAQATTMGIVEPKSTATAAILRTFAPFDDFIVSPSDLKTAATLGDVRVRSLSASGTPTTKNHTQSAGAELGRAALHDVNTILQSN